MLHAAPRYATVKADFTIVEPPPRLLEFISKIRDLAQNNASREQLEELYSDKTELFFGGITVDYFAFKPNGAFAASKPKIFQAARAIQEGDPPREIFEANAEDDVRKFLQYSTDIKTIFTTQPGYAGRFCTHPIISVNAQSLKRLDRETENIDGELATTLGTTSLLESANENSKVKEILPGRLILKAIPNEKGIYISVNTPSGKSGFVKTTNLAEIFSTGVCFKKQTSGEWLIDAIFWRTI